MPLCLWCCWSSKEARCEFEASARKRLRRVARSAPRLFGKPGFVLNSKQVVTFAGKQGSSLTSTSPHVSRAVKSSTPSSSDTTQTSYSQPSNASQRDRNVEQMIRESATANSESRAKSGIGGLFRPGSSKNYSGLPTTTFKRPPLKTDPITNDRTQEGHDGWAKDPSRDSGLSSSSPCSPLGLDLLEPSPQRSERSPLSTPRLPARRSFIPCRKPPNFQLIPLSSHIR